MVLRSCSSGGSFLFSSRLRLSGLMPIPDIHGIWLFCQPHGTGRLHYGVASLEPSCTRKVCYACWASRLYFRLFSLGGFPPWIVTFSPQPGTSLNTQSRSAIRQLSHDTCRVTRYDFYKSPCEFHLFHDNGQDMVNHHYVQLVRIHEGQWGTYYFALQSAGQTHQP